MHIPFLILAQIVTAYIYPPDEHGGHMADIYIKESMPDPLLSYSSRLTESTKIGQAVRTGQVYDPFSGQTMIKTQAPDSPYYNMPYEEAAKRRAIESEDLQREVRTKTELLNQKINDFEYNYKRNTTDQSDRFLDEMKSLDPRSPDYMAQRSQLSSTYPLAAQNPLIVRNLDLLDRTYSDIEKNKDLLSRHALEQEAREAAALRKQEISQGRTTISKYGLEALAGYEDALAKDPNGSPLAVAARMVDANEQQSRISQLIELKVDPKQFYTADADGQATFDTRRADAFIKTYPTASQAHQAASSRERIRQNNIGKYEDWAPDVQADYDLFGEQVKRYKSLTGQSKEEKKAPAVKSVDDFFN